MRILIVTHYFPPENAIASLRPYSWAKYWTAIGHQVTVLTTQEAVSEQNLNLPLPSCEIWRVGRPSILHKGRLSGNLPGTRSPLSLWNKGMGYFKKKIIGFINRTGIGFFRAPSLDYKWPELVRKSGLFDSDRFWDICVCTFGEASVLKVGFDLKEKRKIGKLVFDFRDLWTSNINFKGLFPFNVYERIQEFRWCKQADILTTVSSPLAEELEKTHHRKAHVILNGFDPDDRKGITAERVLDPMKKNILYTGTIYRGFQNPSPLFEAVWQLKQENYPGISDLMITFAGKNSAEVERLLEKYDVESQVCCLGFLKREVILSLQEQADILLFLDYNSENGDGILTGKLYEYLFSGSRIWTVGKINRASRIIEENGLGVALGNDVGKIKLALKRLFIEQQIEKNGHEQLSEKLRVYTREYQARKMLELFC
jgi:hypothetical protein|nr:hypothetical protein [Odoribacter splanchnicus]